ncbi:helix-turn-helix domain-containing protein [Streptomyces sp. NPDC059185]|uniref:helix-turn-helix domain-containing protein n=1 Tax=Streptomyces sp. NPDC059185 TaxID=3346762 RepID=UPI0036A23AE9
MSEHFKWPPPRKPVPQGPARDRSPPSCAAGANRMARPRDLTRESGRSYSFIYSLLTEYGVTFRPRGGDQRSRR